MDKNYLNYFMLPQTIKGIGEIYPLNIFQYDEFSLLAKKYLLLNIDDYNKKNKQQWEHDRKKRLNLGIKFEKLKYEYVFDFYMDIIISQFNDIEIVTELNKYSEEDRELIIKDNPHVALAVNHVKNSKCKTDIEMCKLFSTLTKKTVKIDIKNRRFIVIDSDKEVGYINNLNYDELMDVVINQNLLFKPPISDSFQGQRVIDNAIKKKSQNGESSSLISILSTVSCHKNISDEELMNYTYYRLLYDFEIINRKNMNIINGIFMSQGSKDAKMHPLDSEIDLFVNPYDSLFKEHNSDDSGLKQD